MSTLALAPPVQAELPDWIVALKPPDADLTQPAVPACDAISAPAFDIAKYL